MLLTPPSKRLRSSFPTTAGARRRVKTIEQMILVMSVEHGLKTIMMEIYDGRQQSGLVWVQSLNNYEQKSLYQLSPIIITRTVILSITPPIIIKKKSNRSGHLK